MRYEVHERITNQRANRQPQHCGHNELVAGGLRPVDNHQTKWCAQRHRNDGHRCVAVLCKRTLSFSTHMYIIMYATCMVHVHVYTSKWWYVVNNYSIASLGNWRTEQSHVAHSLPQHHDLWLITNFQRCLVRHRHRHRVPPLPAHSPATPAESTLSTVLGTAPAWRLPRETHCRSSTAPRLSSTATKCREECMRCTLIDLCPLLEFLTGGCAVLHSDSRMAFNYCSKTCFSNCAKHKDIW